MTTECKSFKLYLNLMNGGTEFNAVILEWKL